MGVVTCLRNTAPYTLANILNLLPSLNTISIGMTFIYVVSTSDGQLFFLCAHLSANSKSRLDNAIFDQNEQAWGGGKGCNKNAMVYI